MYQGWRKCHKIRDTRFTRYEILKKIRERDKTRYEISQKIRDFTRYETRDTRYYRKYKGLKDNDFRWIMNGIGDLEAQRIY